MAHSYFSIIEPIIFTASRLEAIANRRFFRPIGLNISSVKIMSLLLRKRSMSAKEIMELVGGTKSNLSQRLDFLEKRGYVETFKNSAGDKRLLLVRLTPQGKKKLNETQKQFRKVKLQIESLFTQKEIKQHFAFFDKLNKFVDSKKPFPQKQSTLNH